MKLAEKGSGAFEEAPYRIDPILSKVFVRDEGRFLL
jgi:hypothetical protein